MVNKSFLICDIFLTIEKEVIKFDENPLIKSVIKLKN